MISSSPSARPSVFSPALKPIKEIIAQSLVIIWELNIVGSSLESCSRFLIFLLASRSLVLMVFTIAFSHSGKFLNCAYKAEKGSTITTASDLALPPAERGELSKKAISPIISPAPSSASSISPEPLALVTAIRPFLIT